MENILNAKQYLLNKGLGNPVVNNKHHKTHPTDWLFASDLMEEYANLKVAEALAKQPKP